MFPEKCERDSASGSVARDQVDPVGDEGAEEEIESCEDR